jgi:folate-binding protein YgfZ
MTTSPASSYARLDDRALIRLEGEAWRGFLQGLLTQDVEGMAGGEIRYAALLTPQGRVLYDLFVTADDAGATLDVAADTREALLARLRMYRLRAKVKIELVDGRVMALFGGATVDPGPGWRRDPRLAELGWRGVDLAPPEGAAVGEYERRRLALGAGDVGRDGLADRAYAMEANLDLLNAIDFRKGCFVGQETTSRMKRRSGARSRLVGLRFEGPAPAPGAEVLNGDLRVGDMRSGADGLGLALLRIDRLEGALEVEGRPVALSPVAWLAEALQEASAVAV